MLLVIKPLTFVHFALRRSEDAVARPQTLGKVADKGVLVLISAFSLALEKPQHIVTRAPLLIINLAAFAKEMAVLEPAHRYHALGVNLETLATGVVRLASLSEEGFPCELDERHILVIARHVFRLRTVIEG